MTAAQTGPSLAAHSVDLIDKDDGRRMALGLVKQIPHTGSAHTHIQFYKIRTGNGEERHTRFSGHRFGDQCFTSARRAHQQNAFGNTGAQLQKFLGSLQKLHHFLQVTFFLIGPGHILESHLLVFAVDHLSPGFAEVHGGFSATVLLIHHIIPEQAEEDDNDQIGQKGRPPRHGHLFRKVLGQRSRRSLLTDGFTQIIIEDLQRGDLISELRAIPHGHGQFVLIDDKAGHILVFKSLGHIGIGQLSLLTGLHQKANGSDEHHQQQQIQANALHFAVIQRIIHTFREAELYA